MTEMSVETNKRVLIKPKDHLLCNILAAASGAHYELRTHSWEVVKEPYTLIVESSANEKPTSSDIERCNEILSRCSKILYEVAHEVTRVIHRD